MVAATLNLMDQLAGPSAQQCSSTSADLLGLTLLNTNSADTNSEEFGEFMSAAGQPLLPFMPSQLLADSMLVDLSDWAPVTGENEQNADLGADNPATKSIESTASQSKSSIMELFGRGAKKSTASCKANATAGGNGSGAGKANWMDLFAELDPLANPDLMEKKLSGQHTNNEAA